MTSSGPEGAAPPADASPSGDQESHYRRAFWEAFVFVGCVVLVAALLPFALLKALKINTTDYFPLLSPFYTIISGLFTIGKCPTSGCVNGWDYLVAIARAIFAAGMLSSMFAQARVDRYLRHNQLFQYTKVSYSWAEFIEQTVSWSFVFLAVALFALLTIPAPILHNAFVFLYLIILALIDYLYAKHLSDHDADGFHIKHPSRIASEFAEDLLLKIDAISLIGLSAIGFLTLLLYSYGAWAFDPPLSGDTLAQLHQSGLSYLATSHWTDAAEVIFSSAVGFHLIVTWRLIAQLMKDWEKRLQAASRLSKKMSDGSYTPNCTEGCGEPHCLLPMLRASAP